MMAGLGSFNAWSVFRRPLSELYGANVTDVNTAFFVSSLVFGLVVSVSALLVGRVGPRAVGVSGALPYGTGLFSSSFTGKSLSLLYLTYGLIAAVGLGLAGIAPIAALPTWFPERPGFAYGVAFIGFGMEPMINVPLMEELLSATGGPVETFYFLGIIYTAIIGGALASSNTRPRKSALQGTRPARIARRRQWALGVCTKPSRLGTCTLFGRCSSSTRPQVSPSSPRPGSWQARSVVPRPPWGPPS